MPDENKKYVDLISILSMQDAHHSFIDDSEIIVDYNRQQLMPGWIPRRLGQFTIYLSSSSTTNNLRSTHEGLCASLTYSVSSLL